jgi:SAM-dependent methyltransferase
MNDAAVDAVSAYSRGEISAEIAVMRLLLALRDVAAVLTYLEKGDHVELLRVGRAHRAAMAAVTDLLGADLTREYDSIAAIRTQFDRAVTLAPEASVALYSLGSAEVLDRATSEIAARLREWNLVRSDLAVLDIGCGIGRIERALAPDVGSITGIDVSPAMVAEAEQRCSGLPNVAFACCSGTDLAAVVDHSFGLILAVDSFPYMMAADPAIAARHIADAARLLLANGALVILNYSYRGDLDADRNDIARLAAASGLHVERDGTLDFKIWDGATFLLRKTA